MEDNANKKYMRYTLYTFILFIVYCTIIPFDFIFSWRIVEMRLKSQVHIPFVNLDGTYASIRDIIQNVLFFIPFGILAFFSLRPSRFRFVIITFSGFSVSLFVETLQLFTKNRYSSINDLITNTIGTIIGIAIAYVLIYIKQKYKNYFSFKPIFFSEIVILCLLSWIWVILCNFSPWDIHFALRQKIKWLLTHFFSFTIIQNEINQFIQYLLCSYFTIKCLKNNYATSLVVLFCCCAAIFLEMSQIFIHSRSPQFQDILFRIAGVLAGSVAFSTLHQATTIGKKYTLAFLIFFGVVVHTFSPYQFSSHYQGFNWLPFWIEYTSNFFIVWMNFLEYTFVFVPLGFIISYKKQLPPKLLFTRLGIIFLVVLSLEGLQGWIHGRHGDITDVLAAICGTMIGYFVVQKYNTSFRDVEKIKCPNYVEVLFFC